MTDACRGPVFRGDQEGMKEGRLGMRAQREGEGFGEVGKGKRQSAQGPGSR